MDSTELQILRRARELISDPERWTTELAARDECNGSVAPWDESAVCWCAVGAMERAAHDLGVRVSSNAYSAAMERLYALSPHNSVVQVNDVEGHAAVLALFDKALSEKEAA
jgi:hypothetical protein